MIHIQFARCWPFTIAMTVKGNGTITTAVGLSMNHAARRLVRKES